ncbi:unnamed protein product [Euphydryas editha]|uniref:Uncharacterized protein n=1 Tax=Euphydryas editha TaxID=104508 RepID=A0AAU9UZB3_EUPED|nr:unnamed protein product [Euphydryas editha]
MNDRGAPLVVSYAPGSRSATAAFTPPPACGPAVYEPAEAATCAHTALYNSEPCSTITLPKYALNLP